MQQIADEFAVTRPTIYRHSNATPADRHGRSRNYWARRISSDAMRTAAMMGTLFHAELWSEPQVVEANVVTHAIDRGLVQASSLGGAVG